MMDWVAEHATLIGLLFFFSFFTVVLCWLFRPGSKEGFERHAQIPLHEGQKGDRV